MRSPVENLPVTIFPNASINEFNKQLEEMDRDRERIVVTHQVSPILKCFILQIDGTAYGIPKMADAFRGRLHSA